MSKNTFEWDCYTNNEAAETAYIIGINFPTLTWRTNTSKSRRERSTCLNVHTLKGKLARMMIASGIRIYGQVVRPSYYYYNK